MNSHKNFLKFDKKFVAIDFIPSGEKCMESTKYFSSMELSCNYLHKQVCIYQQVSW